MNNKFALELALLTGGSIICGFILNVLEICLFGNKKKNQFSVIHQYWSCEIDGEKRTTKRRLSNVFCTHFVILSASSTVDVCVPRLDSDAMAKCLLMVQQKNNVKVRIAIHDSDDFHILQMFAGSGIQVKVIKQSVALAHEFVVLDGALALLGTTPTSNADVVAMLSCEFERVWNCVPDLPCTKHLQQLH